MNASLENGNRISYTFHMQIQSTAGYQTGMVQQDVGVSLLKKALDSQENAVLTLFQGLPTVQDSALGNKINILA